MSGCCLLSACCFGICNSPAVASLDQSIAMHLKVRMFRMHSIYTASYMSTAAVLTGPDRSHTSWGLFLVRCAMLFKAPQTDEEVDIQLAFQASAVTRDHIQ